MTDVRIEMMNLEHLPAILEIEKTVFPTPWTRSMFESEIDRGRPTVGLRSFSIVALRADELVGYAIGWFLEDEVHLVNIAVKKSEQAHGVGSLLLGRVIEEACTSRRLIITLEVRASNDVAREFYRKFMFRVIGVRRGYYTDNREDAVLMALDLEPVIRRRGLGFEQT
ncbi:MAG: ribosomal protein S18-alanine N-acetyltransferase [bacterium]